MSPFETLADAFQGVPFSMLSFLSDASFWVGFYDATRAFFVGIDVVLLCALIYAIIHAWEFHPNLNPKQTSTGKHGHAKVYTLRNAILTERWNSIVKRIEANSPEALKIAIIDADKLVDDALQQLGFEGETMADRLNTILADEIKSLDRLWRAHRIRNSLIHTPGFTVSPETTREVLHNYEAFLKEIKLLD